MSSYLSCDEFGPVYVREKGELRCVNGTVHTRKLSPSQIKPFRLFQKGFSVQLCIEDGAAKPTNTRKKDHFIFTYTKEGNLRYSAKSLFDIVLIFVAENVQHLESLVGFPDQMAEKLFTAAEEKQKFLDPDIGLRALQTFSTAYGNLVLGSLCLRNRFLLVSEKLEEIKVFRYLRSLDLSGCRLGDDHELLEHVTSESLCSLVQLSLADNCLSDHGLRKFTAPVRVLKRGLGNLELLDLSRNPIISERGIGSLSCFSKLRGLDISATGVKLGASVLKLLKDKMGLIRADRPLGEFCHLSCRTEGWAEQVVHQWDSLISESTKPRAHLQPRTNALRFYGKEKTLRELFKAPSVEGSREENDRETLQFHKPVQMPAPVDTGCLTRDVSHKGKKRMVASPQEGRGDLQPSAKRQCATQLTLQDWELLNSY
ncbi:leucine-rich repeat-containing protein 42 [Lepisosteus oculatus]|uniref:leucine-rich repeat-containing protein 42 n=1 Tax=Lepisosteus oculatus TaxID=7918 RepID=UPI00371E45E1